MDLRLPLSSRIKTSGDEQKPAEQVSGGNGGQRPSLNSGFPFRRG